MVKDHLGNEYPSHKAMYKHYGLEKYMYNKRIKTMSLEDALTKPIYALYANGSLSYDKIEILQEYEKYV